MKGIYLGAYTAYHPNHDIIYQDINGLRDLPGDMIFVDLSPYDYVIATPPCNYWSRANYRRETSEYSQKTKHLLPGILQKLVASGKPFIVENVRNDKMFNRYGLFNYLSVNVYRVGRHTYWTNIQLDVTGIIQKPKSDYKNGKKRWLSSQNLPRGKRQGGKEVYEIIELFINTIERRNKTWPKNSH